MSGLDFGIAGKKAIVCASSKGLGFGCANALAAVGVNLVMCARGADRLHESANQLRKKHGVEITEVACDVTTEEGRAKIIDAAGRVDILVNNAGGPPPGDFRDWTRDTLSLIHISEPTRRRGISYAVFCLKNILSTGNCWRRMPC